MLALHGTILGRVRTLKTNQLIGNLVGRDTMMFLLDDRSEASDLSAKRPR